MKNFCLDNVPDPGTRYNLAECLGTGVFGKVFLATDTEASSKRVAIKVQKIENETKSYIEEEYKILRDCTTHPNLVDFYGIYKTENDVWFVLELCEGGPVIDLVNGLLHKNRRMAEEHIAYVLKETVRGLIYLHENKVIHRDIKARNILLTREGEVKLTDFGLSKKVSSGKETLNKSLGSPDWMAPEVALEKSYDNRADVWALGITAIELGDGKTPYQDMNPTRTLFQISRNPPPTLYRMSNWSEDYNDFISECLVKNIEYRPYIMEIIEHPFLEQIPENNYHLTLEIKSLLNDMTGYKEKNKRPEINIFGQYVKKNIDEKLEKMSVEDLAALDNITEGAVLKELEERLKIGEFQTFVGDVLLVLNPNESRNIYGAEYHQKYQLKSRSDNAPHIFAIADTAYQNALHHVVPQRIVLSGESGSGKTTNYLHLVDHLMLLGKNVNINCNRIKNGIKLIHSLTHASTPLNDYSTRCVLKTNIVYGKTGKLTGASFRVHCLEKWRISSVDMFQGNFHILYYIYDGLQAKDNLESYKLNNNRDYRYLRVNPNSNRPCPRDSKENNVIKYEKLISYLKQYEFTEEQTQSLHNVVAAILNLGDIRFKETEGLEAVLDNKENLSSVAQLLKVEERKLSWAMTNYCLIRDGAAIRKIKNADEARDTRDVLANTLYVRLVDYIVSVINHKLSIGKTIFGAKYSVKLLDYFGFECFKRNHLPQFYVNCLNEQLQYHYLQRLFSWEIIDTNGEDVEFKPFKYYDNKTTLDQLLGKPEGVLTFIDDASKKGLSGKYVLDYIQNQDSSTVSVVSRSEFSIAHYTGRVTYDIKEMPDKNRDFLPEEVIETLRASGNPIVQILFGNNLDKTGNLCVHLEEEKKKRFALFNIKKQISSEFQYSQIKKMRTSAAIFRALSLDLLKDLSIGGGSGGTHFVRCIQTNLKGEPLYFHKELVRQQTHALAVVETAKSRQNGYPCRISFSEFLRRYKFLAFDFDESVEITRDNCRLLLIRLKMEGWAIGKTKVFLKYYNEEYLARLYEVQVKKIIKIQSILRGFLTKCKLAKHVKEQEQECITKIRRSSSIMTEDEAAEIIQKAYRKSTLRKVNAEYSLEYKALSEEEYDFIKPYAKKWRSKSIFNVLLQYRAQKIHELINFSQQVHLYNLNAVFNIRNILEPVDLNTVDQKAQVSVWIGEIKPSVLKLRFRLDEIPYYDTSILQQSPTGTFTERDESWDSPYSWRESKAPQLSENLHSVKEINQPLSDVSYIRDPEEPIKDLPAIKENLDLKKAKDKKNFEVRTQSPSRMYSTDPKKEETFITNTKPANKDFDYIKATSVPPKPKHGSPDPIAELRTVGRRSSNNSEDEPPFNFQGMLRKTNFKRDSIKEAVETVRTFSLKKRQKAEPVVTSENGYVDEDIAARSVCVEFGNGLVLKGMEVEL